MHAVFPVAFVADDVYPGHVVKYHGHCAGGSRTGVGGTRPILGSWIKVKSLEKAKKRCFWQGWAAYHNNHGDPDHQTRTRPGALYALALCAPASLLSHANNTYNGENRSNSTTVG